MIVGLLNAAVPFTLFTAAALVLNAALSGILNTTAPRWAALIAWLWLGERPTRWRTLGLAVGFGGVRLLASGGIVLPGTALAGGMVQGFRAPAAPR